MCLKQLLAYSTSCSCERLMKEMVTPVMVFLVSFETKGFILNITEHDLFLFMSPRRGFARQTPLLEIKYQLLFDIFKQSNPMDCAILWATSFTLYKLATENLHLVTISLQFVAKRRPEKFFLILSPISAKTPSGWLVLFFNYTGSDRNFPLPWTLGACPQAILTSAWP